MTTWRKALILVTLFAIILADKPTPLYYKATVTKEEAPIAAAVKATKAAIATQQKESAKEQEAKAEER